MLPTREEAKSLHNNLSQIFEGDRISEGDIEDLYNSRKILEAYSSGTLIEARTEGGITNFIKEQIDKEGIRNNGNNFNAHSYSPICSCGNCHLASLLAHALVGKV